MKKGDRVTVVVQTPWATTEEELVVEKITKDQIFIENLKIPFDRATGVKIECFAGASVYIKDIKKAKEN